MQAAFKVISWLLALLALLADSMKQGPRFQPELIDGFVLPDESIHEVRIRCSTSANQPCSGFRLWGDAFLDGPEGRAYLMTYSNSITSPLLMELPGIETIGSEYLRDMDLPGLFSFDAPYGKSDWKKTEVWKKTHELSELTITIEIKPHSGGDIAGNQHPANCRMLGAEPRKGKSYLFRNIVFQAGAVRYDPVYVNHSDPYSVIVGGDNFPDIKLYNEAGELIPTTTGTYGSLLFDKDQIIKQAEVQARNHSIHICSEDLKAVDEAVKFNVVEP